jgi:hypothetical protein
MLARANWSVALFASATAETTSPRRMAEVLADLMPNSSSAPSAFFVLCAPFLFSDWVHRFDLL